MYYNLSDMSQFTNSYPLTKAFLSNYPGVLIDQKNFPLIEKALNGDFETLVKVAEGFINGKDGFVPHYDICMDFAHEIYKINQVENDPVVILESLENFTTICAEFEDWKAAKDWQLKTIRHMVSNFKPEEWNYTHFDNMQACISEIQKQEAGE